MTHLSQHTEKLARQISEARGLSLEEAVKLAVEETSKELASTGTTRGA
jgi:hypothetical protein